MNLKKYLNSKLHGLTVTEANVNYSGSISIDSDLIDQAGFKLFEMVQIVNVTNGERFETYVIEAPRGSRYIGLNGGAAKKGNVGDKLIVFSNIWMEPGSELTVRVLIIEENNKVQEIKETRIIT